MEKRLTKRCPHCSQDKPLDAFRIRRERPGAQRQSWCKLCQQVHARRKPRLLLAKRLLREKKNGQACVDCGVHYPHYVLDFDHRPGSGKLANLAVLVKSGAKEEVILAEMAKCDLVCANCHRGRTYRRLKAAQEEKKSAAVAQR